MHHAQPLPITPDFGPGELYKQMDSRVHILGVITYEFDRLIAEFSVAYGTQHPILAETTKKDVTAYDKCTETDISKLCFLWNTHSQHFKAKFDETRGYPKQAANLMKEELSRLLYISIAMEKVCLEAEKFATGKASDKEEGLKKWIAATAHFTTAGNNCFNRVEETWTQKVLAESKLIAARIAAELKERLDRRKHQILHNNYVEQFIGKTKRASGEGEGIDTGLREESHEYDRQSQTSYEEFNIEDMRYLRPMMIPPRPSTPMPLRSTTANVPLRRPATPVAPKIAGKFPPPDFPTPSVPPHLQLLAKKFPPQGLTTPYGEQPPSMYTCSSKSSVLVTSQEDYFGFPRREINEIHPAFRNCSGGNEKTHQSRPITPHLPAKPLRYYSSTSNLTSLLQQFPDRLPCKPRVPERNPNRNAGYLLPPNNDEGAEKENSGLLLPPNQTLRSKGSMVFQGKVVKEVPRGEEDSFLEKHAYKGEPF